MPGEGTKAYRLFQKFLALGEGRTVAKLKAECKLSESYLTKLSMNWKWIERVKAHYAEQNELRKQAELEVMKEREREMERRRDKVRENAWGTYQALLTAANLSLRRANDPSKIRGGNVSDAANLARAADIMARIGADMPLVTRAEITGSGGRALNPVMAPVIQLDFLSDTASKRLIDEARAGIPADEEKEQ